MSEKPNIPFVLPTFSWDSPNLYSQFKIFKQKVNSAFKVQFKDSEKAAKVSTILNWLVDNTYEIYQHIYWAADDDRGTKEHARSL